MNNIYVYIYIYIIYCINMSCSSCLELWSFCWILQDVHGRSQDTWAFDTEPFQQPLAAWVQSLNALSRPAYKKPTKEICQRLRLTFFICHQTWLAGKCPSPKWTCYLGGGFGGIPTPLKNMSQWRIIPYMKWKIKAMFETTKQLWGNHRIQWWIFRPMHHPTFLDELLNATFHD